MRGSVADVINMNFESRNSRESVMQNTNRNNGYSKPFAERQHSNTRKPNNGNVTCYKCKKSGNFANNCPQKHKKVYSISLQEDKLTGNNLLNTKGSINGVQLTMTLDTAATTCIISEKIAKENRFKVFDSDVHVKLAHNDIIKVIGVTEKLHVEVYGHTCDLEMYVLPHDEYEVLLGLPWFNATRCAINPAERTLKFNSEIFSIDE